MFCLNSYVPGDGGIATQEHRSPKTQANNIQKEQPHKAHKPQPLLCVPFSCLYNMCFYVLFLLVLWTCIRRKIAFQTCLYRWKHCNYRQWFWLMFTCSCVLCSAKVADILALDSFSRRAGEPGVVSWGTSGDRRATPKKGYKVPTSQCRWSGARWSPALVIWGGIWACLEYIPWRGSPQSTIVLRWGIYNMVIAFASLL